jgi:hypothetical protein
VLQTTYICGLKSGGELWLFFLDNVNLKSLLLRLKFNISLNFVLFLFLFF